LSILEHGVAQISLTLDNLLAFEQLKQEKIYLEEEINTEHNFEEIVGTSPALRKVLQKVSQVAPTSSTVLIQGESGTGKELIARAIHKLSPQKKLFVVGIEPGCKQLCHSFPAESESVVVSLDIRPVVPAGGRRFHKLTSSTVMAGWPLSVWHQYRRKALYAAKRGRPGDPGAFSAPRAIRAKTRVRPGKRQTCPTPV